MDSFVYKWTNISLGKIYIGFHKGTEDDGYICSSSSEEFWNDFANSSYEWKRDILFRGSMQECQLLESDLLDSVDIRSPSVYNNRNNLTFNLTEEVRQKLRLAAIRRGECPEYRQRQSEQMKAQWQNPEHRRKITESTRGKKLTDETIRKIKEARSRQVITRESRIKAAEKIRGVPRSDETKRAISESRKNAPFVTCPHCGHVGKYGGAMKRHHLDNCKEMGIE